MYRPSLLFGGMAPMCTIHPPVFPSPHSRSNTEGTCVYRPLRAGGGGAPICTFPPLGVLVATWSG